LCPSPIHSRCSLTAGSDGTASTPKILKMPEADDCGPNEKLRPTNIGPNNTGPENTGPKTLRPPVGGLSAGASFSAAPHQAAGGWHPAPFDSWPAGRRPFRENPRRHPDRRWPSQTSGRLPPAPSDISYPARSRSPSLRITRHRSRCDYAPWRNPFRWEKSKSGLQRACVRKARRR